MKSRMFLRVPLAMAVAALAASWAAQAAAPESALPIPASKDILAKLKKAHPRVLAVDADFVRIKQQTQEDALMRQCLESVRKEGEKILKQEPSKYEIPDGLRLLATSRRVLSRVTTLAMLYRLENDRRFLDRAWLELKTAAEFKDWNPRHFLDTAEMTHAFAIGYDWLYDAWTPEQRGILRTSIVQKGFSPALPLYEKNTGWVRARHNWNQVCNGGLGTGALAIGDEVPEVSGKILQGALKSIQLPMAEFNPDGAWAEGPGYWNYATMYNVAFLAALDTALGTNYGLPNLPGFAEAGMFPIYMTGPLRRSFNYADAGDGAIRAPHMFWMARKFNQPIYAWYQRQMSSGSALDLLWFDPRGSAPTAATQPLDKYFRASEVVSFRSDWSDPKGVFLASKAGDNKANHSNLDLGTFVLDALGYRWAVDLGADDYNMPGYFGKQRWTYYRLRAESHNTLVINPGLEADQIPSAAAKITAFASSPERAFAIADLTPAYTNHASKVQRGFALLNRRQVLIQDEVETVKPAEIDWFMTTPARIALEPGGRSARLTQGKEQLVARILAPEDAQFTTMEAGPLPTSPAPTMQKKNTGMTKLAIKTSRASSLRLVVLLSPGDRGEPMPLTSITPLSTWSVK